MPVSQKRKDASQNTRELLMECLEIHPQHTIISVAFRHTEKWYKSWGHAQQGMRRLLNGLPAEYWILEGWNRAAQHLLGPEAGTDREEMLGLQTVRMYEEITEKAYEEAIAEAYGKEEEKSETLLSVLLDIRQELRELRKVWS